MNADERDQIVDQALKQAFASAEAPPAAAACLDAETLAAWMDGGLDPQSMAMAEAHASACARCQALLGTMVTTMPAATGGAAQRATLWRWWFAPLAAGVAATTLWMVVPEQRAPAPPAMNVARAPAEDKLADAPARDRAASPPASEPVLRENAPKFADRALSTEPSAVVPKADEGKRKAEIPAADERADFDVGRAERRAAAVQAPAAVSEQAIGQAIGQLRSQALAAIEVVSPDPAARWRIGGSGAVDYSTDGGGSWERLAAAVTAELTAGSSPSPTVCWLVGRGGAVLLATDGRTFATVAFPEAVDLAGVRATDALSAAVTTLDGRTFLTTDAGKTWRGQ